MGYKVSWIFDAVYKFSPDAKQIAKDALKISVNREYKTFV